MGSFCKVADFILYLLICKFVAFAKRLKKASAENIYVNIYKYILVYEFYSLY